MIWAGHETHQLGINTSAISECWTRSITISACLPPERTGLLDGLSLHSRGRDSTYSSMSDSGRHSPTPTLSSLRVRADL